MKNKELQELQLETDWPLGFTIVKNAKVFVVLILQQVCHDAKDVEDVDLQEAWISLGVWGRFDF